MTMPNRPLTYNEVLENIAYLERKIQDFPDIDVAQHKAAIRGLRNSKAYKRKMDAD